MYMFYLFIISLLSFHSLIRSATGRVQARLHAKALGETGTPTVQMQRRKGWFLYGVMQGNLMDILHGGKQDSSIFKEEWKEFQSGTKTTLWDFI